MRAVMLAAGVGRRLGGGAAAAPKALLRFGGRSLLARHIDILRHCGIEGLSLVVGYRAADILAEIAALGAEGFVRILYNPDYRAGSIASLWVGRVALCCGTDVLLMDADVLYDQRLMARLVGTRHANCFLMDREFEDGDEPVKLGLRAGRPVEFHKRIEGDYDLCAESVGFFRLAPAGAEAVVRAAGAHIDAGRADWPYEEALRDALRAADGPAFGCEDVTGLPWIEIDFPEDVRRAREEVLPRLAALPPGELETRPAAT